MESCNCKSAFNFRIFAGWAAWSLKIVDWSTVDTKKSYQSTHLSRSFSSTFFRSLIKADRLKKVPHSDNSPSRSNPYLSGNCLAVLSQFFAPQREGSQTLTSVFNWEHNRRSGELQPQLWLKKVSPIPSVVFVEEFKQWVFEISAGKASFYIE